MLHGVSHTMLPAGLSDVPSHTVEGMREEVLKGGWRQFFPPAMRRMHDTWKNADGRPRKDTGNPHKQ